jgi:S-DNA-T family DNA segregation ATPase FtsK/SpoIIIE
MVDSKTILDGSGAQQLVGKGDLLFSQGNDATRVQCAFVDTPEVENIVHFISEQRGYPSAFELPEPDFTEGEGDVTSVDMTRRDEKFEEAARFVVATQQGSVSMIQRKFEVGFNRAARIMDQLEAAGIVGAASGSKPRQVLIHTEYELEQMLHNF